MGKYFERTPREWWDYWFGTDERLADDPPLTAWDKLGMLIVLTLLCWIIVAAVAYGVVKLITSL